MRNDEQERFQTRLQGLKSQEGSAKESEVAAMRNEISQLHKKIDSGKMKEPRGTYVPTADNKS